MYMLVINCLFSSFRGILKSDKVLGTASLKLQPLDEHCELHESLDVRMNFLSSVTFYVYSGSALAISDIHTIHVCSSHLQQAYLM
jgi:hypothetical protein